MQPQFFSLASLLTLFAMPMLHGSAAGLPEKRQIVVPTAGSIVEPSNYTVTAPGAVFDFDFDSVNYCESGYEPITVWLFEQPPSVDDMASDGTFQNGTYLYYFGKWLIANFGLPPMQTPPDNLTMPDFSTAAEGSQIFSNATFYLTVVETYEEVAYTANVLNREIFLTNMASQAMS